MDVDTLHAIAPRPPEGFCDQPAPVPLTRHLGDQADEAELALPWLTKVELEQADVRLLLILHGEDLDAGMVDDGPERSSSRSSRENHSQGAPTRRKSAR